MTKLKGERQMNAFSKKEVTGSVKTKPVPS